MSGVVSDVSNAVTNTTKQVWGLLSEPFQKAVNRYFALVVVAVLAFIIGTLIDYKGCSKRKQLALNLGLLSLLAAVGMAYYTGSLVKDEPFFQRLSR